MTDKKKWFCFSPQKTEETSKDASINVRFAQAVKVFLANEGQLQELFTEAQKSPDFNPNYTSSGRSLLEMSIYKFNLPAAKFLLKQDARVTKTAIRLVNTHSFQTVFGKEQGKDFMDLFYQTLERQKERDAQRSNGNIFEEAGRFLLKKLKGFGR